ncbi:MAG: ABC transporter ATP-binding protein [Actinomycetota bacterium]|nr:ABC transporter ATP-binding protein [Actinomycetota bacterium]
MSSEASIQVRRLSKSYGLAGERSGLLSEAIARRLRHPFRVKQETYWALRDVSLEVHPGEVLGIVGKNGAGKSTLLKIMSRITEPTSGEIELRGRLGCLLEVGTGFHPELTGRENVFLNGAILGMRKAEIQRQFDEIVDFAGIERFLDTPVKRYSSGMYVRLAFAVAAHLSSEILVVDEVLAVGDIEFQKKCLGKMQLVASQTGRTVVFVSHNVTAVKSLCTRAVLLHAGRVVHDGDTAEALHRYVDLHRHSSASPGVFVLDDRINPDDLDGRLYLSKLTVEGDSGPSATLQTGRPAAFTIECRNLPEPDTIFERFHLRNELDEIVLASDTRMVDTDVTVTGDVVRFEFEQLPLLPGRYFIDVGLGIKRTRVVLDQVASAGTFEVDRANHYGEDYQQYPEDGSIYLSPRWRRVADQVQVGMAAPIGTSASRIRPRGG